MFFDSVGRAHGALLGNATISNGELILPGGGAGIHGDHARLLANGPDGININQFTNATFAIWATTASAEPAVWSRYFDLGGTSVARPGAAGNSIFLTPNAAAQRQIQFTISNVDPQTQHGLENFQRVPEMKGPTPFQLHHIVVTFDGTNDVGRLYVDGRIVAEDKNLTHQLELLQTDYALLGASLYASDNTLNGSISQFEIYDTALSPQQVAGLYDAGPVVGPLAPNPPNRLATGLAFLQSRSPFELAAVLAVAILILMVILLAVWLFRGRKQRVALPGSADRQTGE